MTICSRRVTIAATVMLALAGAAQAAEAPDGPMTTAGASGAPPTAQAEVQATAARPASAPLAGPPRSTAEQIDDFIRSSPAAEPSPEEMAAMDEAEIDPDRRVHGTLEVGVGSHGYRHAGVTAHYPVGKSGHVSVAVGTTRGRGALGYCSGPFGARVAGPLDGPYGPGCF